MTCYHRCQARAQNALVIVSVERPCYTVAILLFTRRWKPDICITLTVKTMAAKVISSANLNGKLFLLKRLNITQGLK